jgi:UDP-glucose 4-epimerase
MNILLTGGAGYIGSHTAVALAELGYSVVLYDNLSNSNRKVVDRINKIVVKEIPFVQGDVRDIDLIAQTLDTYQIEAVIHFAGLKAVGESVVDPLAYYSNNVQGTISLLQAMQALDIKNLVFSSSATVYGEPQYLPIDEEHPINPINPYGKTKAQIEEILDDIAESDNDWRIVSLRYFNPVGAHETGLIGEDPNDIPNNLMPYIAKVAVREQTHLQVFGDDYPTTDGTGIRDYIHVMDLAEGHVAALEYLNTTSDPLSVFNLGSGRGLSVFDMLNAFKEVSGREIKHEVVARRSGDVAECYAKVDKAREVLDWEVKRDLEDVCASVWKFQKLLNDE